MPTYHMDVIHPRKGATDRTLVAESAEIATAVLETIGFEVTKAVELYARIAVPDDGEDTPPAPVEPVSSRMWGRPDEGERRRTRAQIDLDKEIETLAKAAGLDLAATGLTADALYAHLTSGEGT